MVPGTFARGLLVGVGLMYFLDPDRGRPRRGRVRDKAVRLIKRADRFATVSWRDARNRVRGAVAEVRSRIRHDDAEEPVLEARVRAAIGRAVSNPGSIETIVEDGMVTLTGPVLAHELDRLTRTVERVHGVLEVIDELEVYEDPDDVPGLQGAKSATRHARDGRNWTPAKRMLTGLGGAAITLAGRRLPLPLRVPARLMGLGLLARAITNTEARRLIAPGAGRPAVQIQKSLIIERPIDEVFAFWSHFENFPRFMSHLREVRRTGDLTSRWVAEGPAGTTFDWNATITDFEENRRIAWESDPDSSVRTRGAVTFEPVGENVTRIHIRLEYDPPAGRLGHGLAALFGKDAKHALNEDLVRLKSLLEEGRTTAHGEKITRAQVLGTEGKEGEEATEPAGARAGMRSAEPPGPTITGAEA